MPTFATQQINSGFGTYHPGDPIDDDVPPTVREAWLAAGLAEVVKPVRAVAAAPSTKPKPATKPKPEKATRVRTHPEPHRRFVENATAPAPERGTVGPEAD